MKVRKKLWKSTLEESGRRYFQQVRVIISYDHLNKNKFPSNRIDLWSENDRDSIADNLC